jgi:hypothetical protein
MARAFNTDGFKWHDWLMCVMFFMLIGVGLGYAWRMHHESISTASMAHARIMPFNSLTVADLSYEISKGREFWLPVNESTMLHFLPLNGARFQMAIRHEPRE